MKPRLLSAFVFGLGLLALVNAGLSHSQARAQATCARYVLAPDGSNVGRDCSDQRYPCRTVQYALSQVAADSEVICVADHSLAPGPSVYTGTLVITRSVTLDGEWQAACVDPSDLTCSFTHVECDPQNVVLDAQAAGRVISITGASPTINCFTITGGDAAGQGGDPGGTVDNDAGGGVFGRDASPIIVNNVIVGNYGCNVCPVSYGRGGGIYLINAGATAIISGNLIGKNMADNSTWGQGGGIMLRNSQAQVRHNTIQSNRAGLSAGNGGGIAVIDSQPIIADNKILTNVAGTGVLCNGGGIYVWSATPVTIERNLIQANRALDGTGDSVFISSGGGIYYAGKPSASALIRDNTILNNIAATNWEGMGGGLYLGNVDASALVSGNTLEGNVAGFNDDGAGGGIYLSESDATIENNRICHNTASPGGTLGMGGGLCVNGGAGLIRGNVITYNTALAGAMIGAGSGGGLAISNSLAIVQDNWIAQNQGATAPNSSGLGGGVYVYHGAPSLLGNHILDNTTGGGNRGWGGGLYAEDSLVRLERNTILDNRVIGSIYNRGGGVHINSCPAFTLTNNIIARNAATTIGSGIALRNSAGLLVHNTIAQNQAGDGVGVWIDSHSTVTLTNNIIASQTVGISNTAAASSIVSAQYTLFDGNGLNYGPGVDSAHEIAGPAALLPDYHISSGSGARDTATPLAGVTIDIDGDPRPIGPAPDVGADEYIKRLYLPLVLRNFQESARKISIFSCATPWSQKPPAEICGRFLAGQLVFNSYYRMTSGQITAQEAQR